MRFRSITTTFATLLLLLPAMMISAPFVLGNGDEEGDEGHMQSPVVLNPVKPHHGSVGSFSESFYAFQASAPVQTISIKGSPAMRWRLFSGANFKDGLMGWCKPASDSAEETTCQVEGLVPGNPYYLNVYTFSPEHSDFRIHITVP